VSRAQVTSTNSALSIHDEPNSRSAQLHTETSLRDEFVSSFEAEARVAGLQVLHKGMPVQFDSSSVLELVALTDEWRFEEAKRLLHRRVLRSPPLSAPMQEGLIIEDVILEVVGTTLTLRISVSYQCEEPMVFSHIAFDQTASVPIDQVPTAFSLGVMPPISHHHAFRIADAEGRTTLIPMIELPEGGVAGVSGDCNCFWNCILSNDWSPEWGTLAASVLQCLILDALPNCLLALPTCHLWVGYCGLVKGVGGWLADNALEIALCTYQCSTSNPFFIDQSQPQVIPNPVAPNSQFEIRGSAVYDTCVYVLDGNAQIEIYDAEGTISTTSTPISDGLYSIFIQAPSSPGQYGIQVTATSNEYNIGSPSITSNIFVVQSSASSIVVDITELSPNPANYDQPVIIAGTAAYNNGDPVASGTALLSAGGAIWSAAVINGTWTRVISAPQSSSTVSVTVADGVIDGSSSAWLQVNGTGGGDGYTFCCSTTCRDVQDNDPWDPIYEIDAFSQFDDYVFVWVRLNDVETDVSVRARWYGPDGTLYSEGYHDIEGQPYDWYKIWWWHEIEGTSILNYPGEWSVQLHADSGSGWILLTTETFVLRYDLVEHLMALDVQPSDPWDPIAPTNTFYQTDSQATAWMRLDNVSESLDVKWEFYEPNGSLYDEFEHTTDSPDGFDYWDWYKVWGWIPISGSQAAQKCGNWQVRVHVESPFAMW